MSCFFFAGIYTKYDGVEGCSTITREATLLLSKAHHRIPAIIAVYDSNSWLAGEDVFDSKLSENINCHPFSTIVSSLGNNDKTWVESLPPNSKSSCEKVSVSCNGIRVCLSSVVLSLCWLL